MVGPAAAAGLVLHDDVETLAFFLVRLRELHAAVADDGGEREAVTAGEVALAGHALLGIHLEADARVGAERVDFLALEAAVEV